MTIDAPGIVSLKDYRNRSTNAVLASVEEYWNSLRGNRLMPSRSEVDPRGIATSLEYAFVLERVAPGMARFRLAGMHLRDLMGMEVRGMPLTAMIAPGSRPRISEALTAVFDEPAKVKLTLAAESSIGRPALSGQLLLLPLRSDLGDASRVLGCLAADGRVGRAPRRFAVTSEERRTLTGYADTQPRPGKPLANAPELPKSPTRPSGVRHLQLVKSD